MKRLFIPFSLRIEIPQNLAADDGENEIAVLEIHVGEKIVVEDGEESGDLVVGDLGRGEKRDRAGHRAVGQVVEVDGDSVGAVANAEKTLGVGCAESAFPDHGEGGVRGRLMGPEELDSRGEPNTAGGEAEEGDKGDDAALGGGLAGGGAVAHARAGHVEGGVAAAGAALGDAKARHSSRHANARLAEVEAEGTCFHRSAEDEAHGRNYRLMSQ